MSTRLLLSHEHWRLPALLILLAGSRLATLSVSAQELAVTELQSRLGSGSRDESIEAARHLAEWGPLARTAVPELTNALKSDDVLLRYEAALCLGAIGPDAEASVDSLIQLLTDESDLLRFAGINALRLIGSSSTEIRQALETTMKQDPLLANRVASARALAELSTRESADEPSAEVLSVLIEGLKRSESHLSTDATHGLSALGEAATTEVVDLLKTGNPEQQSNAVNALALLGLSAQSSGSTLLAMLPNSKGLLQRGIVRALPAVGADAETAIPVLKSLLSSDSSELQLSAIAALGDYGESAETAVPALARMLNDDDQHVQRAAAAALGEIGTGSAAAVPLLLESVKGGSAAVAIEAAHALGRIGQPAVAALTSLLSEGDLREFAATVLSDIGAEASGAVPALLKLLDDDNENVRRAGLLALAGIGPAAKEAVPRLTQMLNDPQSTTRGGAAYALAHLGAKEVIPDIRKLIEQTDDAQHELAGAWALVMLDASTTEASHAIPVLVRGLEDEWDLVRRECASALGALGPRAKSATPALLRRVDDTDPLVRAEALVALHDIGADTAGLLPLLIKGLDDVVPEVRYASAFVLGSLGSGAKTSTPRLRAMLNHRNEFDRIVAAWALTKVSPTPEVVQQAVPLLVRALSLPRPRARQEAAAVLGEVGEGHPEVGPALERALTDEDAGVRAAAHKSLDALKARSN